MRVNIGVRTFSSTIAFLPRMICITFKRTCFTIYDNVYICMIELILKNNRFSLINTKLVLCVVVLHETILSYPVEN